MRKINRVRLDVTDGPVLEAFYIDVLGMQRFGISGEPRFGYASDQCLLEFRETAQRPYVPASDDFYWKIGITVRDLDHAVGWLRSAGIEVGEPRQFRDIGYMAHLCDPEGFAVELLQHGFEGRETPAGDGHAVGGQATLAHVTLRVSDLASAQAHCEGTLGMRLMSVQPVPEAGFCLYFYGWSDEALPVDDLEAVGNREWLWARPYALLELQHLETAVEPVRKPADGDAGFAGFGYADDHAEHFLPLKALEALR